MQQTVENKLADKLSVSQAEADRIWNATQQALKESILEDSDLRLRGFGTFKTVERAARKGRNFQTGEEIVIPPYNEIVFEAGQDLELAINGNGNGEEEE